MPAGSHHRTQKWSMVKNNLTWTLKSSTDSAPCRRLGLCMFSSVAQAIDSFFIGKQQEKGNAWGTGVVLRCKRGMPCLIQYVCRGWPPVCGSPLRALCQFLGNGLQAEVCQIRSVVSLSALDTVACLTQCSHVMWHIQIKMLSGTATARVSVSRLPFMHVVVGVCKHLGTPVGR